MWTRQHSRRNNIMRINTNITAINTYTQYSKNNNRIGAAVAKLSSGYAINSAADNAAGLAISEKMRAQIRGLGQASTNSQDAISLIQTAEGALSSSTEILQRMRELAVQSANDTNADKVDREAIEDEFHQLKTELDDIARSTSFNKRNLLDGSLATTKNSVTNTQLGNNSLAVSLGNADAGRYNFNVKVKQETAAIEAKMPDTPNATLGATATTYFSAATCQLGTATAPSALLNGNYSFTSELRDDGSLSVTATGDNGQVFNASVSANALANATTSNQIDLVFSPDADDAFHLTLTTSNFSNTTNGIQALNSAIADTTVSIVGGVTAMDATYGVYASITGGDDVKLHVGDTSVTFNNGITVSFNELTAADLDTKNKTDLSGVNMSGTSIPAGGAATTITYNNLRASDDAHLDAGNISIVAQGNAAGDKVTFRVTNGTKTYEAVYTEAELNNSLKFSDNEVTGTTASKTMTLKFTADDGSSLTLDLTRAKTAAGTGADTGIDADAATGNAANLSGTAAGTIPGTGTSHNYSKVFGNGNTALDDSGTSAFTVVSEKNDGLTFQIGANSGDELVVNVEKFDAQFLGVNSAKVSTQDAASAAIEVVDNAINQVSTQRAYLGAIQNRLGYKINNLDTSFENLTSAESQIRDIDMAKEMTEFTNAQILSQAATSMLAQANSLPQNVLSLIGG